MISEIANLIKIILIYAFLDILIGEREREEGRENGSNVYVNANFV